MGHNRTTIAALLSLTSGVLPGVVCVSVLWLPAFSKLDVIGIVLPAVLVMALLVLVNWWEFTSLQLRWVWGGALVLAVATRFATWGALPALHGPQPHTLAGLVLSLPLAWMLVSSWRARAPGEHRVALAFPFRGGRFLVTDGGDGARSFLLNYHYGFGTHRAAGVSASMRFAMDVVAVGPWGSEGRSFLPERNDHYRIWEWPVLAPCDGEVVHVVSDVADNPAFSHHRPYGVGNHVVLRTGGDVCVVLGHLRQGSVRVQVGDRVSAGAEIARAGNSGWTERPHLHMQAMRSRTSDWWHGEPLAMLFGDRFPVRNQVVDA